MSKKSNTAVVQTTETQAAGDQKTVSFAPARKYTSRQDKAVGQNFDPNWAKRDATFTLGHAPKSPTSVMGTIYGLVAKTPTLKGSELAAIVRMYEFPNRKRSQYLDGIPPIGWAEDYINGAIGKGYLKLVQAAGTPADAPKEPKQEPVKPAEAKK